MAKFARFVAILFCVVGLAYYIHLFAPAGLKIYLWAFLGVFFIVMIVLQFVIIETVILRLGGFSWTQRNISHVLITGESGSGKTSSAFKPLFLQLNKNLPESGGLIIETKGDEGDSYKALLLAAGRKDKDFIRLSVKESDGLSKEPDFPRINLIGDPRLSWTTHATLLTDVFSSVQGKDSNPFFQTKATNILAKIFELMELKGDTPTISKAYDLIIDNSALSEFTSIEHSYLQNYPMSRRTKIENLSREIRSEVVDVRADGQREGILGSLTNLLGNFNNPRFREVFCSEDPNVYITDFDLGKWISVQISQSFIKERIFLFTYIKLLFYQHALIRLDDFPKLPKLNFLFGVLDEFQNVVTTAENGIADHNTIDKLRQSKVFLWLGVQAHQSMDGRVDIKNRDIIVLNCATRIHLRAPNQDAAEECSKGIGQKEMKKKSHMKHLFMQSYRDTVTVSKQRDFILPPEVLISLKPHQAIIVHPSKKWRKVRLARINDSGEKF